MSNTEIHWAAARGDLEAVERELRRGVHVDTRDDAGRTPLLCAAADTRAGLEMLDRLLGAGANPGAVTVQLEETPLRLAARSVRPDWVHRLLEAGATATWASHEGYGPVLDVVYGYAYGDRSTGLEVMQLLLNAGADPGTVTSYRESPLRVASDTGHFEAVSLLLGAGADPEQLGWSPLHRAVALGTVGDVAEMLRHGADLAACDWWERTPWLLALAVGDVQKAEAVLSAGARLGDRGRCMRTNLMYPPLRDSADCLAWRLDQGADLKAVDEGRETPLMTAAVLGATRCVEVLLAAGADVRATNHVGASALNEAATVEVLRLLVAAGADMDYVDGTGYSVLKTAAEDGNVQLVRAALELGASPHVTSTGDTPLHAAVAFDQLEIVRLLLDAGADPNARDGDAWTPVMLVRTPECERLLLAAGADV